MPSLSGAAPFSLLPFALLSFAALSLLLRGPLAHLPCSLVCFPVLASLCRAVLDHRKLSGRGRPVRLAGTAFGSWARGGPVGFSRAGLRPSGAAGTCGPATALSLATAWTIAEWLRGHVLTGFPWNLAAYALADWTILAQAASVLGSYGLGSSSSWQRPASDMRWAARARKPSGISWGGCSNDVGLGHVRIPSRCASVGGHRPRTTVRIVPAEHPTEREVGPAARNANIARLLFLSARPGAFDLLLWPETAWPGFLPKIRGQSDDRLASADRAVLLTAARSGNSPVQTQSITTRSLPSVRTAASWLAMRSITSSPSRICALARASAVPRIVQSLGDFSPGPDPRLLLSALSRFPALRSAMRSSSPGMWSMTRYGPTGSSTRPTTPGSAPRSDHGSTSPRPGCVRSKKACRWFARPTPEFRPWSTRSGASRLSLSSANRASSTQACRGRFAQPLYARFGDWMPLAMLVASWTGYGLLRRTSPRAHRKGRRMIGPVFALAGFVWGCLSPEGAEASGSTVCSTESAMDCLRPRRCAYRYRAGAFSGPAWIGESPPAGCGRDGCDLNL